MVSKKNNSKKYNTVQLFWLFTFAAAIWQCFVLCFNALDLAPDEAHYWEWSKQLDWAYYSKGPLIAFAIRFGTSLFGDTEFGIRFPAVLAEFLFSIIFFFYARKRIGAESSLLILVVTRLSVIFLSMGFAITTDPILILAWLLALIAAEEIITEGDNKGWLLFGLWSGLGVLAKYTAIMLPVALVAFIILDKRLKTELKNPWAYLGAAAFLLAISPIIIWNIRHGWVNLGHNAAHIAGNEALKIRPQYVGEILAAQFGLYGPLFYVVLLFVIYLGFKEWRSGDSYSGFLSLLGLSLLGVCIGVSFTKRVYANWPIPVGVTAIFLLVRLWALLPSWSLKCLRWSVPLHIFLAVILHLPLFNLTFGFPGRYLTTKKLAGWKDLAEQVRSTIPNETTMLAAENYDIASELAFYLHRPGEVLVGVFGTRRMNQYDIWGGWNSVVGRDFIITVKPELSDSVLENYFEKVSLLAEHSSNYSGDKIQRYKIYLAERYNGREFPKIIAR